MDKWPPDTVLDKNQSICVGEKAGETAEACTSEAIDSYLSDNADAWIYRILGKKYDKLYRRGYELGLKRSLQIGYDTFYAKYFAEGYVQGRAEVFLMIAYEKAKQNGVLIATLAEKYCLSEIELERLYREAWSY